MLYNMIFDIFSGFLFVFEQKKNMPKNIIFRVFRIFCVFLIKKHHKKSTDNGQQTSPTSHFVRDFCFARHNQSKTLLLLSLITKILQKKCTPYIYKACTLLSVIYYL